MTDSEVPRFLEPMLARLGSGPFDSPDHVFEWKWDGFRALVRRAGDEVSVRSRRDLDLAPRFPELGILRALPDRCLVDGEIVALEQGRPSFELLLRRERTRSAAGIETMSRIAPVLYVAFDLLYEDGRPLLDEPLHVRRERLRALLDAAPHERIVFSDGVVGKGMQLFAAAGEHQFEGIVAKRLESRYLPGRRTDDWIKIKRTTSAYCVVLGFLRDEAGGLKSLVVGTEIDGKLTCVGRVGSGLSDAVRETLLPRLERLVRATPVVSAPLDAIWVEPEIFCTVSYVERTRAGMLRAPVFRGLVSA